MTPYYYRNQSKVSFNGRTGWYVRFGDIYCDLGQVFSHRDIHFLSLTNNSISHPQKTKNGCCIIRPAWYNDLTCPF